MVAIVTVAPRVAVTVKVDVAATAKAAEAPAKDKDGKERPADPRMPRGGAHITGTVTENIPSM